MKMRSSIDKDNTFGNSDLEGDPVPPKLFLTPCTLCYQDFDIFWARSRPGAKVGSYGAPMCFRADFAAVAEILMRCT
eukprot:COSAG01_NODE_29997_length_625_cov_1.378327_1_plen_76_part_01